jgi:hypothetical protein
MTTAARLDMLDMPEGRLALSGGGGCREKHGLRGGGGAAEGRLSRWC